MKNNSSVTKIIALALEEDMPSGDITSDLTIDSAAVGTAELLAKEKLTVCGLPLVEMILSAFGCGTAQISLFADEGARVPAMSTLATVRAPLKTLLSCERTILNFLQRLSGVATHTAHVCAQAKKITVLDTRKTMPGFRVLDKYAVRIGGGKNHRAGLSDMVLVKNNHIDANGGDIRATLEKVFRGKPPYMPVEVEVRTMEELEVALDFEPSVIMLDNMNDREIKRAVAMVQKRHSRSAIEISGGIDAGRLSKLQALGVTVVSMGSLTTHAPNVDISLRIK